MVDRVPPGAAPRGSSDAVEATTGLLANYPGRLAVGLLPWCTRLIVRGKEPARAAASHALGLTLPATPCRALGDGDRAALWLGPDEWLVLAARSEQEAVTGRLRQAFEGKNTSPIAHALIDVSDRQISYEVTGPLAGDVLNSGCPLDLDLQSFPVGMCTRTLFGKAEIVLWRPPASPEGGRSDSKPAGFRIEIQRSYAAYLRELLTMAAAAVGASKA